MAAGVPTVRLSIRSKFVGASLLVLLPFLLYTVYDYRHHQAERRELILEKQELTARLFGGHIDTYLGHLREILGLSGREAAGYLSRPARLREALGQALTPGAPFSSLAYFSEKGALVEAYPKLDSHLRGPHLTAVAQGRPYTLSDLFTDDSGVATIGLWVRVEAPAGGAGIMAATLPARELAFGIETAVGRSGVIEVSDATGRAIFSSHDFPLSWDERDRSSVPPVRSALRGEVAKSMSFIDPLTGRESLGVSVPVSNGWVASVFQSVEEATSSLRQDSLRTGAVWGFFILLALVAAWFTGAAISAPIRRLAEAATAIGRGEYSTRVEVPLRDEVGILAANLNAMAQRIGANFAHQRLVADTLQRAFLPDVGAFEGRLELGAVHASATEEYIVGGDFYDVFRVTRNNIALVVGDISGKGIDAASLSVQARYMLKAFVLEGLSPGDALARLNEVLFRLMEPESFVSVFLALLDQWTWTLRYANAGHPGPLMTGAARYPRYLGATGPVCGALPEQRFREETAALDPRGTLVLYTDGIVEARHHMELFGERRLEKTARKYLGRGAQSLADGIYRACVGFTGGRLCDDITLLVVQRAPGSTLAEPPSNAERGHGSLSQTG